MAQATILVNSRLEKKLTSVAKFIEALGGQSRVAEHYGLGRAAVHKWCSEDSLPGYLHHSLVELAAERGIEAPPASFFRLNRKSGSGRPRKEPRNGTQKEVRAG